jgi:hypothetical protein
MVTPTEAPPPDPQYQYLKELHAAYQAQRTEADKVALELGGRYEKMLSLIAGGALAVSITFIEKIAPSPVEGSRWVALIAWLLLGGANVATLIAISASHRAQQKKIENLDTEILQKLNPTDPKYQGVDTNSNPFIQSVQRANTVSIYSAVLGLICLILFVFLNFPAPKKYEQKQPIPAATTAAAPESRPSDKLLRADEKPDISTSAAPTPNQEIIMPTNPKPTPPQPSTGKPLTESYVPTPSPVAPPPPPQNPPPKGK